jgi:hypothetical protein
MTIKRPAAGWKLQRVTTHPGNFNLIQQIGVAIQHFEQFDQG